MEKWRLITLPCDNRNSHGDMADDRVYDNSHGVSEVDDITQISWSLDMILKLVTSRW
jgi:hypothetical protein